MEAGEGTKPLGEKDDLAIAAADTVIAVRRESSQVESWNAIRSV